MWDQSLWELFERGGPVMWPLLAASVIGLALVLDRAIAFLWCHQGFRPLIARLGARVTREEWDAAERLLFSRRTILGRLARTYLQHRQQPAAFRNDILAREGKLLLGGLQARVRWLGIVGQLAPMLGLLGTVTGLVSAFHQVEKLGGQVAPSDLAQGIWEALITTVAGLVIAIPCMAAYHAFQGWADRAAEQLGFLVSYLDQWRQEAAARSASRAAAPNRQVITK